MMMNPHTNTAAINSIGVILAGGQSSRMGTDKAALRIRHESLLQRTRRILQEAGCSRVLLSGHTRPDWSEDTIPDLLPGAGPVGGIVSALTWAEENAMPDSCLLFAPVDAPLLSPTLLASMLNAAQHGDGCLIEKSPLPVVLRASEIVLKRCSEARIDLQSDRSWSVRRFVDPLVLKKLDVHESTCAQLINVNTPSQWESLLRELENSA